MKGPPRPKHGFRRRDDGVHAMSARLHLSGANEVLGSDVPVTECHTVGGLLLTRLRHISRVGESIVEEGYRFTVTEASERAATELRVERI